MRIVIFYIMEGIGIIEKVAGRNDDVILDQRQTRKWRVAVRLTPSRHYGRKLRARSLQASGPKEYRPRSNNNVAYPNNLAGDCKLDCVWS